MVVTTEGYRRSCEYDPRHHNIYNSDHMHHHHCDHNCGGDMCGGHTHHHPYVYAPTPNQPIRENMFMINETIPYLVDHTQYKYGLTVSAAHDIETRIVNRNSTSCINLDAVFDLTEKITPNAAWIQNLEQLISMKYETLNGILPLVKSTIKFRMYYTVKDSMDEPVIRAYCDSPCQCGMLNQVGDVPGYFVTSYKNIFTDILSSTGYSGLYTFTIDKVEAIIETIDLPNIITYGTEVNPYYTFSHTNTQIDVFHEPIQGTQPTEDFVIAVSYVNKSFTFETNVSTKIKVNYIAYMNNAIIVPNTVGIWSSLFTPTEAIVKELKEQVNDITTQLEELKVVVDELTNKSATILYDKNTPFNKGDIVYLEVGKLYHVSEAYRSTSDEGVTVEESFENDVAGGKLVMIAAPETTTDEEDPAPPPVDDKDEPVSPPEDGGGEPIDSPSTGDNTNGGSDNPDINNPDEPSVDNPSGGDTESTETQSNPEEGKGDTPPSTEDETTGTEEQPPENDESKE